MYDNCQACGNAIISALDYGTEPDGRRNRDFCTNCYKSGNFYSHDWRGYEDGPMPVMTPMFGGLFTGRMAGGHTGWF
jgi:hypothetical protein